MDVDEALLPTALRGAPTFGFVGRDAELTALRGAWAGAAGGQRVTLIAGDAGTGKSRLVRELAHVVAGDGGLVLYGACDPTTTLAYQPITEALAHLVRHHDADAVVEDLGPLGGELARLLPDLPHVVAGLPAHRSTAAETDRHRLHAAVLALLEGTAARRPVLLVVDDLHWADRSTALLLRQLMRRTAEVPLLVVAAFRDADPDATEWLAEVLAEGARLQDVVQLRLDGLDPAAVGAFVDDAGGAATAADRAGLVAALHDLTGGNAFLVGEVWRHLQETGVVAVTADGWRLTGPPGRVGSPDRVLQVVGQRLTRLAPATRELLEVAATVGPTARLQLLRAASALDEQSVLGALEQAVAAGMLEVTADGRPTYRFGHELVRRAIYDRMNAVARARLHLRVAEALERMPGDDPAVALELADHFTAAAAVDVEGRAAAHCLRAADTASRQLAFDEAAGYLHTALELGVPADAQRTVHRRRGHALRAAGRWHEALDSYHRSAELARDAGDAAALADAALGFEETCWRPGITDRGAAELLAEAVRALGDSAPGTRARLMAALARAHGYRREVHDAAAAYREAAAVARSLDDPTVLARVLAQAYWGRGTTPVVDVLADMTEGLALATAADDLELCCTIRSWRGVLLAELGRFDELERETTTFGAVAEQIGQAVFRYQAAQAAAATALLRGQLQLAEEQALHALELSALEHVDAGGGHGIQMFGIRREQDRLGELAPALRVLAANPGHLAIWRPALAVLLAELGMDAEARGEVARLCADGFAEIADDGLRIAALVYLAEACALTGDRDHAALLYAELLPLSGTLAIVAGLVACFGAIDRHLGVLATCTGSWADAEAHLTAAVEANQRIGSPTWTAHALHDLARMLLARRRPGDADRAGTLLAQAERTAGRHGLVALRRRIAALTAPPVEVAPDGLTAREVDVLREVVRGRSNREIGEALHISANTAANHVRSILMKTGCTNRTEAASYAHRHGLADEGSPG